MKERNKKYYTPNEAKLKVANYCAYQERSQKEVRSKLYDLGLYPDDVEDVLTDLITDGYINEERFAKNYVRGKFKIKKWGRKRIEIGLKQHNISPYCMQKGFEEIDQADYRATLERVILKKATFTTENDLLKKKTKVANHALYKGFELDLVWELINDTIK